MSDKNPAENALDSVREVLRGDEGSSTGTTFMRGLTLGALLGAAIAGSALWQRRTRAKQTTSPDEPADGPAVSAEGG